MILFNDKSKLTLHRLVLRKEDNSYICGRKETEIYIETSEIGYQIIKLLEKGTKIGEVKKSISKKYGKFNVDKFIRYLILQDYVEKIDNKKIPQRIKKIKTLLRFIDPKYVRWIFSKPMYLLYLLIFLSSLFILLINPGLFPVKEDYLISNRFIILLPVAFVVSWIFVFLHEFMHFLAAKSYKLPSSFGISNRLFFLVAATDITNMYSLERKKRFRIILAGILTDVIVFSLAIITLYLYNMNLIHFSSFFYKILKFLVLSEFLVIIWQFLFFMKTDVYYAFENAVKLYNINDKAEALMRNEFFRLFIKDFHLTHFDNKREKNIVHAYSLLILSGILLLAFTFFYYSLPITLKLLFQAYNNIIVGLSTMNYGIFYDAMFFVLFFLIDFGLLAYAVIRHYRLYLRPILYYLTLFALITTGYLVLLGVILALSVFLNSYTTFYFIISIISLLFALFLIYLVWRIDKFDVEDFYARE